MKIFDRFFYHIHQHYKGFYKKDADVLMTTFLTFAGVQCFGLMAMVLGLSIAGVDVVSPLISMENREIYVFAIYLLFSAANYVYFTHNERYKNILSSYSKRPLPERKKWSRITLVYVLSSILLVFLLAPLRV